MSQWTANYETHLSLPSRSGLQSFSWSYCDQSVRRTTVNMSQGSKVPTGPYR